MNREQAKELLPIIQAWADGKTIQFLRNGGWVVADTDVAFNFPPYCYRIKPEARLRPWKAEEAPKMVVMRDKRAEREQSLVYTLQPSGFYRGLGHAHDWTLGAVCDFCVRISEDGSEHPCGVMTEDAP